MVAVIREVDKKDVGALSKEVRAIAKKAREKGLSPQEMQGGCITISSLGGLGAGPFTPIVNSPEVAILGVAKSYMKPVWQNNAWQPQLTLPLCLSYDHRAIDGAQGAAFVAALGETLAKAENALFQPAKG